MTHLLIKRFVFAASIWLTLAAIPAFPQTAELKETAREPYERGLLAAQQQEWDLALRYFGQAYQADPTAPQVWFNLGLTSSKMPGRELRAISWFKAYLLVAKDSDQTRAVKDAVRKLEVSYEASLNKVLRQLVSMRSSVKTGNKEFTCRLVSAMAFLGDTTAARSLLEEIGGLNSCRHASSIIESFASGGDTSFAFRLTEVPPPPESLAAKLEDHRNRPYSYLVKVLAKRDDLVAAERAVEKMTGMYQSGSLATLSCHYAARGQLDKAQQLLRRAATVDDNRRIEILRYHLEDLPSVKKPPQEGEVGYAFNYYDCSLLEGVVQLRPQDLTAAAHRYRTVAEKGSSSKANFRFWPMTDETGGVKHGKDILTESELDTTDDTTFRDILKRISERNVDPSVKAQLSMLIFEGIVETYYER